MEKVILVSPNVSKYLVKLVGILYDEGYFSFEQSAHEYIERLRVAIYRDIPRLTHHTTRCTETVWQLLRENKKQ